jgi:hypothetical protein
MSLIVDKILGRLRQKDKVTKADIGLGNVDNTSDVDKPISDLQQAALDDKVDKSGVIQTDTDYVVGDICELGAHHETALFLECITAGNTGPTIPDINIYDYYVGLNIITIGTVVFKRKLKTSCSVGHVPAPLQKWYKIGDIPASRQAGAFDLSVQYSAYSVYHLQVEMTLLINNGDNKIIIDDKSRSGAGLIFPVVALIAGDDGLVQIWVQNLNITTYALGCTSMNYDDVFNVNLYNTFAAYDTLPGGAVLAQIDTSLPLLTDGSVLFSEGTAIAEDNVNFFWDNVLKILKVLKLTVNGIINITGGEATVLGLKALQLPNGVPGIDAGLSVRTGVVGESIVQFGNNHADYYTGAIDQSRAGSMLRLDTRNAIPVPGGHAYSAIQLQTRGAGVAYTGYKVPFQISGQAQEGSLCIMDNGVVYFYYGINVQGKTVTGLSAPTVITETYTVQPTDDIIICNSAVNIYVGLPAAVSGNRKIVLKNINTGIVTITVALGGSLDDRITYELYQWDSVTVLDNSGKYLII